ncbi:Uncharacterized protein FKW44_005847 [Caligus rogercresseyi]|uniref:Uncharacterized protein n=1 Tax=Caligus rogercresseyi TaxID=217165 RepID=A0A7T8KCJ8_CALRO|nr:Uncharacterized protein FKW44_005847 [Caligus rogercresseyi]
MEDSEEDSILEAEQIYVLMKKDFRLSRNTRAQWYFNHLDSVIRVSKYESIHDFSGELDVVSVVPKDPDSDWDWDIVTSTPTASTPAPWCSSWLNATA